MAAQEASACIHVPVVPIRMTEAWLLADETAIRRAAGNPNGTMPLDLPSVARLENIPDPKRILHDVLRQASGLNSRRRASLPIQERTLRIPQYIDDFSPLDALDAFRSLQADIANAVSGLHGVIG